MQQSRANVWGTSVWRAVVCLFIGIITMRELSYHVAPGLDETYRWALNYFLGNNKEILATITYTYGPLCLLKWPVAIGDHILIASLFNILLNATFTYSLISLHTVATGDKHIVKPLLLSVGFLVFVSIDYVFVGLVTACIVHLRYHNAKWPLGVALLFTAIGMYIKTSMLVLLLSIWGVFVVYNLLKKQFIPVLVAICGGVIIYLLLGLLIFHDAGAALSYGVNNIAMAFEYTDALNLFPVNNIKYLLVSLASLIVACVILRKERGGFVFLLLSVAFFANWKYAMGYEDFWHAATFLYLVAIALVLVLVVQQRNLLPVVLLFCISISCYAHNLNNLVHYRKELAGLPDISLFNEWVLHHKENKERTWNSSIAACEPNKLPGEWLAEIGGKPVDIVPFDLSIALVNGLNYKPRPTMQAGLPGPKYDRLDAESYANPKAAKFLVWHSVNAGKTNLDGIDDNYLPNTNPNLVNAILTYYHPAKYSSERYTLWVRNEQARQPKKVVLNEIQVRWNEWTPVLAADSGDIIRAVVDINANTKYKLRSAVYKGLPVYVEYGTISGKVYRYRFSASQAKEGMLLQPFFMHHDMRSEQVIRVRFINERPSYYRTTLTLQLYKLDF